MNLIKKGNNYFMNCPFHNDDTASLSISFDKGVYHCFGCGAKGKVEDLLSDKQFQEIDIIEILKNKLLDNISKQIILPKENNWNKVESDIRNLPKKIYSKYDVKIKDNELQFPLKQYGRLIGYYYYDIKSSNKRIELNTDKKIYPQYEINIQIGKPLIVVEGIFDMLRCNQYYPTIALIVIQSYRILKEIIKEYSIPKLYVMLDGDNTGRNISKKIKDYLDIPVKIINLPDKKDPMNYLKLEELLKQNIPELNNN